MNDNSPNRLKTKTLNSQLPQKNPTEDRQFTFKIIKRRSPWSKAEDDAIIDLVGKYGTGNWTIIANEMSNTFSFKNRSGKQCRERWHNHLDPHVNKESWTEKEENILFAKHLEYGNKWSDIAKFLPGRTDNAIKNHFYSKFRKYIRKILKQINKENLMKINGIDSNQYNGDKIYKLLKKYKITYKNLNKETLLGLIVSVDKNIKSNNDNNGQFLKNKTKRPKSTSSNKKLISHNIIPKSSLKRNSNAKHSNPVINTIKTKNNKNSSYNSNNINNKKSNSHKNHIYLDFINNPKTQKKRKRSKRRKVSICLSTPENKKKQINKCIFIFIHIIVMPTRKFFNHKTEIEKVTKSTSIQKLKKGLISKNELIEANFELLRPGVELHHNQILVINKNVLNTKDLSFTPALTISNNTKQLFPNNIQILKPEIATTAIQRGQGHHPFLELNLSLSEQVMNNINPTPHYGNIPIDDNKFYFFEAQPQLSPMNLNDILIFPPSTRNLFNLDITPSYSNENFFKNQSNFILPTPKQTAVLHTPKKEVSLQNKIFINEKREESEEKIKNTNNCNNVFKPPQIDLNLVNQSETNNIFLESIGTFKNNIITSNRSINHNILFDISPINAFIPKQNE